MNKLSLWLINPQQLVHNKSVTWTSIISCDTYLLHFYYRLRVNYENYENNLITRYCRGRCDNEKCGI